jgi:hypothetical protein
LPGNIESIDVRGSSAIQFLVAKEDDIHVAAQLGEILDPSGPFQKTKGAAMGNPL